jgi:hypothetical protein
LLDLRYLFEITDNSGALEFLQGLAEKVKHDVQAHILVISVIAGIKLEKRLLEEAKATIEIAKVNIVSCIAVYSVRVLTTSTYDGSLGRS